MSGMKKDVLTAFRMNFRPIARILLRAGVNWQELAEIAKTTYVEVASADFGVRGRPTNVSKVAILTGFTRREVRRLRSMLLQDDSQLFDRMNRATRLLTGWHSDPDFVDDVGDPLPLSPTGDLMSFETLCRRYASDVPFTTMQKELLHVGAVSAEGDMLIARTRYYMPVQMDAEQVLRSGSVFEDLGNTVAYNLHRSVDQATRFERRASVTRVSRDAVPLFREFLENEGQAFLERVDQWLTEHELDEDSTGESVRLGLGAYWIQQ